MLMHAPDDISSTFTSSTCIYFSVLFVTEALVPNLILLILRDKKVALRTIAVGSKCESNIFAIDIPTKPRTRGQ